MFSFSFCWSVSPAVRVTRMLIAVLAVAVFQGLFRHTGKRMWMKSKLEMERSPDFLILYFCFSFSPSSSYKQFPLPFFSNQSGSQGTSFVTKTLSFQGSFRGLFMPSNNFSWLNPKHTIVGSIREFMFWVPCSLFVFIE